MIFGKLERHLILNTSLDSKIIKFVKRSGATWQKLITLILLQRMLREVQYKKFSITSLDKLPTKTDCSSKSKDGKTEAVHNLLEH